MRVYIQVKCVPCPYHNAVQAWHEEEKENDISNDLLPCAAPAHAHTTFRYTTHAVRRSLRHAAEAGAAATSSRHAGTITATPQPHSIYHAGGPESCLFLLYSCVWRRAADALPHDCLALNLSCSQVRSHTRWTRPVRHADSRQSLHHDATRASTCMSQPSRSVPLTT